ncbi:zinc ribbon domain-containing protein [Truepera radiovictrix]|uniref:Uncharacterized protein n=1 Tax=Truepera radiovictrix (strain DSM 17093 / CIP 108686 / LMG 22925 / RQ-24) TaxID=649638 RepID=D7CW01_TRURR|nr:C4-type zinc ribbon domain-containing protein [Truepera radiovictrix]ADI14264.1 protein of unknown function DUF164 [Truepera radiovictrix DSM 17093]WMT57179.1 C4-type zinc ribbon domain-containing protein [Truepera radiovictrix]
MLDKLNQVQLRDLDLDALREERERTPEELLALRERKERLQGELARTQEKAGALRREVSQSELEIRSLDERRKGASRAALEASSPKEASQYQNQELQFATRLQELEEDTLPLIERLEALDAEVARLQGELDALEPELEASTRAEEARVSALEAKITALTEEREALAASVDAPLLRQYEGVRRAKRGVGLVEVVDAQRCGGCNVRLPIHVVQKARSARGVTRCPSCGRILWVKAA